jgi:hypothetical protein
VPAPPSHPHVLWTRILDCLCTLDAGLWILTTPHSPRRSPPSAYRISHTAASPCADVCHHLPSAPSENPSPPSTSPRLRLCRPAASPACRHRSHHPTALWRLVTHKPSSWRGSTFTSSLRSVPFSAQRRGSTEATTRSPHNWAYSAHPLALIHTLLRTFLVPWDQEVWLPTLPHRLSVGDDPTRSL